MKIAVYTIAKNEEQFALRWAESCADADYHVVADTGSTDATIQLLQAQGVSVTSITIAPWRFDRAREAALALVPADADICITLDMDEVLAPGWRTAVEAAWTPGTTRLHYRYVWNWLEDGSPGRTFMGERCHSRDGYRWVHAVHETLKPLPGVVESHVWTEDVQLHHHADDSKPRSQYLPLLKMSVEESPADDRCAHYYGRELMYYGQYREAITELERHLALPSAQWLAERSASHRYIARCYEALSAYGEAQTSLFRACAEAPDDREPWYDLAEFLRRREDWLGGVYAVKECIKRAANMNTYLSEPVCRGAGPYDVGSVCAWYAGLHGMAEEWVNIAAIMAPADERIQKNQAFILGNLDIDKKKTA